jgi:hypothetical protein
MLLTAQPVLSSLILAFRTVTIATRMVTVLVFLALATPIDMTTQRLGAAMLDSPHRFSVTRRYPRSIFLSIGRPILAKDIG